MVEISDIVIGALIFVALIATLVPVMTSSIHEATVAQRSCLDDAHPYECLDNDDGLLNWCSNVTSTSLLCLNTSVPILNVSTSLCTNASGVRVINSTPISGCDSTGYAAGIGPYTNTGLSTTEATLLGLTVLFLVLAGVFTIVKSTGLMKQ